MPSLISPAPGAVITQHYGQYATAGVVGRPNGTTVEQLVFSYGNYQPGGHDGIDYGCAMRTPLIASLSGVVDFSGFATDLPADVAAKWGWPVGAGNLASGLIVAIDGGDGFGWATCHMDETWLDDAAGRRIAQGDPVGLSGNSGRSGGPHCHATLVRFSQVRVGPMWGRVDPAPFMKAPAVRKTLVGLPGIYI